MAIKFSKTTVEAGHELLTKEEQVWWRGNYPHPVRILLYRLAAEREKLAQIKAELRKKLEA